jgi:hypothetical protein
VVFVIKHEISTQESQMGCERFIETHTRINRFREHRYRVIHTESYTKIIDNYQIYFASEIPTSVTVKNVVTCR